ncbi:DUF6265 family protein [Sphingobacterium sp. LRF_L2]|uniref:DUF6265 family protein n=1 Tax=Sphingobacterium sp. LRF_L2 TaxID=3369421 RepID=UPI003F60CDB9
MKSVAILFVSLLILSCNQAKKTNQTENTASTTENNESLDWLVGNWKRSNEEAGKETYEYWKKINPTQYSGIGFTLQKGDTISQEKMDIIESDGKWNLFVKMPAEKEATKFMLIELKKNGFTCVNDSIDFPNNIQYWMEGEKLKAKISNEEMEIPFDFVRIN